MGAIVTAVKEAGWDDDSEDDTDDEEYAYGEHPAPELSFLCGLTEQFAEEANNLGPNVPSYPVPDFLTKAHYERYINIAITGNSGVGKSLFINCVRGVKRGDPTWAPVGVGTTTTEPRWYCYQEKEDVKLWDVEGAGCCRESEEYARRIGARYFDMVLVLSSSRFTETEIKLMAELRQARLPHFFVRTKLDIDIGNNEADHGMTAEETVEAIRQDMEAHGVRKPYLVSVRNLGAHDFPRLLKDVLMAVGQLMPEESGKKTGQSQKAAPSPNEKPRDMPTDVDSIVHDGQVFLALPLEPPEDWASFDPPERLLEGMGWSWARDEDFYDFMKAETGAMAANVGNVLLGSPEHQFWSNPNGSWCLKIVNNLTGQDGQIVDIWPNGTKSPVMELFLGPRKLFGYEASYFKYNMLVTEVVGQWEQDASRGHCFFRQCRYVKGREYTMLIENVIAKRRAHRVFRLVPHFVIHNLTEQVLKVRQCSTSVQASMSWWPVAPSEVQPGTSRIKCLKKDVEEERLVFELPDGRRRTVSVAQAFNSYTLRSEDFG